MCQSWETQGSDIYSGTSGVSRNNPACAIETLLPYTLHVLPAKKEGEEIRVGLRVSVEGMRAATGQCRAKQVLIVLIVLSWEYLGSSCRDVLGSWRAGEG